MKLLVITQKVDRQDEVLGFFHRWLLELAQHYEQLTVICLTKGDFDLPANVSVLSLGKPVSGWPVGQNRWCLKVSTIVTFYRYLWQQRENYDRVLVHMNPIYIVLAGCYWRLICRPVTLWYTHRQVDWKLRLATFWATQIFTAAPESFRLASAKVKVLGHGIDTAAFSCPSRQDNKIKVITHVGRLTAIKHCETLILAAKYLQAKLGPSFVVRFVGGAATTLDQAYVKKLQQLVSDEHLEAVVEFSGPVSNQQIPAIYCASDLSVNLTPTGGLDKSVLESMAAAVPVLSSNQAFRPYFGSWAERLLFPVAGAEILATKIEALLGSTDLASIGQGLQGIARGRSDVKVLIDKMVKFL